MNTEYNCPPVCRKCQRAHRGACAIIPFNMDGMEHTPMDETGCCQPFAKRCSCGGWMHYQPVYGGYYYECEVCHKTD